MGVWIISSKKRVLISFLVFIILLFSNSLVYSQWASVTPPTVSSSWVLKGVHFTSPGEGWAVGDDYTNGRGVLLHYSGGTWTSVIPPAHSLSWGLDGVYFTSPTEGWAVGQDVANGRGVLLHYSGGTWSSVNPPSVSSNWALSAVNFASSAEGWAVGADYTDIKSPKGVLLRYVSGAWSPVSLSLPSSPAIVNWTLEGVHFTSVNEGWAGGGSGLSGGVCTNVALIFHYLNGTWTPVTFPCLNPCCSFADVYFVSPNEGWGVGNDSDGEGIGPGGSLFHYLNGTWTSVNAPSLTSSWWYPNKVYLASANEGWAVGLNRYNWPTSSDYIYTGVLLHYSGGIWMNVTSPYVSSNWWLEGVHFTSPREGWAVGRDFANKQGVLLHYFYPTLTITKSGTGSGTVTSNPAGIDCGSDCTETYNEDTVVTLTATPASGSTFGSWSGDADCSDGVVTMNADKTCIATFNRSFVNPSEGTLGTEITISGNGYGAKKGKVLLGSLVLKILSWSEDSILAKLLKPLSPGIYNVTVQPKEPKGTPPIVYENSFTLKAPEIDSVDPTSGLGGDNITIYGSFFGTKKGKVTLGGKSCKVLRWTMDPTTGESEIQFVVPKRLTPGVNELKIINGMGSDTVDFTVE